MSDSTVIHFLPHTSADHFIMEMLKLGKPIQTSLVGAFDESGRGSRRDIDLPLHQDGDYSTGIAEKHSIDWVGLYCVKGGEAKTIIEFGDHRKEFILEENQAVIFNNKLCKHAREGKVGDRILLRVWAEKETGV